MSHLFDSYTPVIQNVVRDEGAVVLEMCGIGLAAGATDVVLGRKEIGCQAAHRQLLTDRPRLNTQKELCSGAFGRPRLERWRCRTA